MVAEEVRSYLAKMGLRSLQDAIGINVEFFMSINKSLICDTIL